MKLAIARACVALGIKQCEKSVMNSLADIMRTYIETIGRYSQEQAEISHRACPGIQDVIPVLEYTVTNLLSNYLVLYISRWDRFFVSLVLDLIYWNSYLYGSKDYIICELNSCIISKCLTVS